jgi:phosphoribosylpyrophosphate synthetase
MSREPIDSSVIASMGYAAARRILEIEFHSGDIYDYFDVPEQEYVAFRSAESKGTYLNQIFKPRGYLYIRIQ